jgi:tripartite-type tricarboxylate transporter receptor subunit TctC
MTSGLRRTLARGAAALFAVALGAVPAAAQEAPFPTRPIRLVVPWPAGTSSDVHLRVLAQAASRHLGQPVVVENRPGAAGTLAAGQLASNTRPDGYTIAQMPINVLRLPAMQRMPFDPAKDFTYVIHLTGYMFGTAVRADAPWRTWQEFIAHARANPDEVTYATSGHGGTLHLTMEEVAQKAGLRWRPIHFAGNGEQEAAVLGGHVTAIASASGMWPSVAAGRLRLLVVWSDARTPRFPEVPTLRETGLDIVSNSPYGLGGPAGIPPHIVRILHDAFKRALYDPEHIRMLESFDQPVLYLDSDGYRRFALDLIERERELVTRLGLAAGQPAR